MAISSVMIRCGAGADPVVERAAALLARELQERTGVRRAPAGPADIVLGVDHALSPEGFRIRDGSDGEIRIDGGSPRGVVYGVGRFLRSSQFGVGTFTTGTWRGDSAPEKPFRGIYFASHFHNYYHNAPLPDVERYVEELALWGYNLLVVWFDMHHYRGIDDPAAQAMLARLRRLLKAARGIGMGAGLVAIANEGFSTTPAELRAKPTGRSHYGVEVCPSQPGGRELVMRNFAAELDAFADVGLDAFTLWPYDQGGCGCAQCVPWGANGFLRLAPDVAGLVRERFPEAKIALSTWLFDYCPPLGEWEGLTRAFASKPDWVDYLVVDSHTEFPNYPLAHGAPGGLPMLSFPEISMWDIHPWGGFGASPLPARFQRLWDKVGDRLAGGYPYSEGIFEDLTKAVVSQFYWNSQAKASTTVREYLAYEFGPEQAADLADVVEAFEANHAHWVMMTFADGQERVCCYQPPRDRTARYRFAMPNADWERVEKTWTTVQHVEARLAPRARASWRWRLLYLRAAIDHEIHLFAGQPTPALEAYFAELCQIYHVRDTVVYVAPPTRENVLHAPVQSE